MRFDYDSILIILCRGSLGRGRERERDQRRGGKAETDARVLDGVSDGIHRELVPVDDNADPRNRAAVSRRRFAITPVD